MSFVINSIVSLT